MNIYDLGEVNVTLMSNAGIPIRTIQFNTTKTNTTTGGDVFEDILLSINDKINNVDVNPPAIINGSISTSDIFIPGSDNIIDLRFIISHAFNIPVFRIALFTPSDVFYKIILNNNMVIIPNEAGLRIQSHDHNSRTHIGMPIDIQLYEASVYRVESDDHSKSIGLLISNNNFHIYDMKSFIGEPNVLSKIASSDISKQYIYRGFIRKYWPICSAEIFERLISGADFDNTSADIIENYPQMQRAYQPAQSAYIQKIYNIYNTPAYNKIYSSLNISIKNAVVELTDWVPDISMDTMFHELHATWIMPIISYNNGSIIRRKTFVPKMSEPNVVLNPPSIPTVFNKSGITIAIWISLSTTLKVIHGDQFIYINIDKNIRVLTVWRDDYKVTFSKHIAILQNYINPIFAELNVNRYHYMLNDFPTFDLSNTMFVSINVSISWPIMISPSEFNIIKSTITNLYDIKIFTPTKYTFSATDSIGFNLISGPVYSSPYAIDLKVHTDSFNYYSWMYNAEIYDIWNMMYSGVSIRIEHHTTEIKIDISDVQNEGLFITRIYIIAMITLLNLHETVDDKKEDKRKIIKLRNTDPILFGYRDIKSGVKTKMYSIACQEPKQPIIMTEEEYKTLSADEKKKHIKYWNFTHNNPVYYKCPNPEYPFFGFQTGVHPNGFCLPCCQKTDPTRKSNIDSYTNCLSVINSTELITNTLTTSSIRHIFEYNNYPIEQFRLGKIPWLQDILNNKYPASVYLVGVTQYTPTVSNCGIVYALSVLCNFTVIGYIRKLSKFVIDIKLRKDLYNLFIQPKLEYVNTRSVDEWIDIIMELTNMAFGIGVIIFDYSSKSAYTTRHMYANNYLLLRKTNAIEPIRVIDLKKYYKEMPAADNDISKIQAGSPISIFTLSDLSSIIKITAPQKISTILPAGTKSTTPNAVIYTANKSKKIGYIWYLSGEGLYIPSELYLDITNTTDEPTTVLTEIPFNKLSWKMLKEFIKKSNIDISGYVISTDNTVIAITDNLGRIYFTNTVVSMVIAEYPDKLSITRWGYNPNEIYGVLYDSYNPDVSYDAINSYNIDTHFISKEAYKLEYIKYITYRHILLILILAIRNSKNIDIRAAIINLLKSGRTTEGIKLSNAGDEQLLNRIIYRTHYNDLKNNKWENIYTSLMLTRFDFDNYIYYNMQSVDVTNEQLIKKITELIEPYMKFDDNEIIRDEHFVIYYDITYYKDHIIKFNPKWINSTSEIIINQLANDVINPLFESYFTGSSSIKLKTDPLWKLSVDTIKLLPGEKLDIII